MPLLNSIVNFRAFAIIIIVAGHMYPVARLELDTPADIFAANLVTGGTTFFVFISGYMFHYVFYPRFSYARFMLGKCRTVLAPYIVVSIPFILWFLHNQSWGAIANWSTIAGWRPEADWAMYLGAACKLFLTGAFNVAAWYIPFVILLFSMSPLHVWFIRRSFALQSAIVVFWFALSLVIHRPLGNLDPLQAMIYFTPVYLIGIMCSQHRDRLMAWISGKEILLLIGVVAANALQVMLGKSGNYHGDMFGYDGIDLMLIHKTLLTVVLFCVLERWLDFNAPIISLISSASFALFFLHPGFLILLSEFGYRPLFGGGWLDLIVVTIFVCGLCLGIALGIKALLGKRSRYVLGY